MGDLQNKFLHPHARSRPVAFRHTDLLSTPHFTQIPILNFIADCHTEKSYNCIQHVSFAHTAIAGSLASESSKKKIKMKKKKQRRIKCKQNNNEMTARRSYSRVASKQCNWANTAVRAVKNTTQINPLDRCCWLSVLSDSEETAQHLRFPYATHRRPGMAYGSVGFGYIRCSRARIHPSIYPQPESAP